MVRILVMGNERNYYEVEVNKENLYRGIGKAKNLLDIGNAILDNLEPINKISASRLSPYGCQITLVENGRVTELIGDVVEKIFEKAKEYAEKHQAPYVLIQDLNFKGTHLNYKISGLAQLLVGRE